MQLASATGLAQLPRQVRQNIHAREIEIGHNVLIEDGVTISGVSGPADKVVIGDNVYIGADTKIRVPSLSIGDYARINNHSLIYGYRPTVIGHNAWFGQNIILNSTADLHIGNNCCIGAYSQLWTHFQFGDVMEGCRFNSVAPLTLGNDVWISGNCVVSPIVAEDKSLAMPSSVVTADMKYNRVYAGNPARDVTEKLGPQFSEVCAQHRREYFMNQLQAFFEKNPSFDRAEIGVRSESELIVPGRSVFDLDRRSYSKHRSATEFALMLHLLPGAKFVPE